MYLNTHYSCRNDNHMSGLFFLKQIKELNRVVILVQYFLIFSLITFQLILTIASTDPAYLNKVAIITTIFADDLILVSESPAGPPI